MVPQPDLCESVTEGRDSRRHSSRSSSRRIWFITSFESPPRFASAIAPRAARPTRAAPSAGRRASGPRRGHASARSSHRVSTARPPGRRSARWRLLGRYQPSADLLVGLCADVLVQALQLPGAWDGHDPRLLGKQPAQRDLGGRRVLPQRDAAEQIDQGLVRLPSLRREAGDSVPDVGAGELGVLVEMPLGIEVEAYSWCIAAE
jgi:hypothetical protein